jgi:hypothetical protein
MTSETIMWMAAAFAAGMNAGALITLAIQMWMAWP